MCELCTLHLTDYCTAKAQKRSVLCSFLFTCDDLIIVFVVLIIVVYTILFYWLISQLFVGMGVIGITVCSGVLYCMWGGGG